MVPVVLENDEQINVCVVDLFFYGISCTDPPILPPRTNFKKLMAWLTHRYWQHRHFTPTLSLLITF